MGTSKISWILPAFNGIGTCDIYEEVYKEEKNANIKEYVYADDYIYGVDDED